MQTVSAAGGLLTHAAVLLGVMMMLHPAKCFVMRSGISVTSSSLLSRAGHGAGRFYQRNQAISMTATQRPLSTAAPVTTEIAKLNYIDFNPATDTTQNTPVIIMHGLLGNCKNFQSWGAKLVGLLERPRRVFAVDMRNHGASSHHAGMTYPDMAGDIVAFMEQRGLGKAVLVGHSMGGKVACMTALLHPERVQGLVVMDIAPVPYSVVDQTNWGETQRIIEAITKLDISGVTSRRDADGLLEKDIVDPMI
eukprot:Partr_v1_DN22049_c1_g1_i1_m44401 putative Abhydrolase domain containing